MNTYRKFSKIVIIKMVNKQRQFIYFVQQERPQHRQLLRKLLLLKPACISPSWKGTFISTFTIAI